MAQIQAKWPKSGQNLGIGGLSIGLRGQDNVPRVRIGVFWPDLGYFAWIWAIMLGFGPYCLDLGHIAWILAIWQNLGQNRPERRRSPEDGATGMDLRTYVRTNRQIPPVFYRTSSPLEPLPKKGGKKEYKKEQVAQGQYVVSDTCCPAMHDCEFV